MMIIMGVLFVAGAFADPEKIEFSYRSVPGADDSDQSMTLHSKITIEGEEKDMTITISGVDQPAEIKIGERIYMATLKQVMDSRLVFNTNNSPRLRQRGVLVVQIKGVLDWGSIGLRHREDRYPEAKEVKLRYPEELPFTGIVLDAKKATSHCDDDEPFNAVVVDDNLLTVTNFSGVDHIYREHCLILQKLD